MWIKALMYLFSKDFWELKDSKKCLTGRLILLNKNHPHIPDNGKYRPIRVCSNVVKLLESYLLPDLESWGKDNLQEQFGFCKGLGPEAARTLVFNLLQKSINRR
jgi:hypothetical protein